MSISRRAVIVLALLIAYAAPWFGGFVAGTVVEANTHALHVSRITGAPYLQVLDPMNRNLITSSADEVNDEDGEGYEG
jgi:hypothetical protein